MFPSNIRPTIVCLCGSTRFYKAFIAANYEETMKWRIVLSVGFYPHAINEMHGEGVGINDSEKEALDELHKRKIDLADEVLILNVGGYVGESTLSEAIYAAQLKKPLRWLEPMQCPCCKGLGGYAGYTCTLCRGTLRVGE